MTTITEKRPYVAQVKSIMAFRFLADYEAYDLLEKAELNQYEEGEPIVEEGDVTPYLYGILEGSMGISVRHQEEDRQVYVNTLGAGDVFGEAGIFTSVARTATVTAQSNSLVLAVHRDKLARFLKEHAEAGNKVLLVIIYGLLLKLKATNQELAFERKDDMDQAGVDAMVESMFGAQKA
jgi:CRP/FNR family cyclic AMP-dependent transcriptional regulator